MEKFGITTATEDRTKLTYICLCGNKWEVDRPLTTTQACTCGNTNFKHISESYHGGRVTSGALIKVIENGDWGFVAKKYKVSARYARRDFSLVYDGETETIISFDFRKNEFFIRGEKIDSIIDTDAMREFMFDIDDAHFLNTVCTEKMKIFIEFGRIKFGKSNYYFGTSSKAHLCNGLPRLVHCSDVQILCNAGFSKNALENYQKVVDIYNVVNRKATKPHEILQVSKYLIKYMIDYDMIGSGYISNLRAIDKKLGADGLKAIFQKMTEEADIESVRTFIWRETDDFIAMIDRYKYNPQQLINYVFRDVKLQQGISNPRDALNALKDYMRMMTTMELHPDKYTKSLKKDHDIAQMNYKTQEDEFTKREFAKVVEGGGYADLEYKTGGHAFITPKSPKDIIREGSSLSHCVASYVKDVVNGRCKIFFLRNKEDLDKSLITIELRGNRIVQAKGQSNRLPNENEKKLMKKWAENKKLELAC
jgi:hypothetical protein